MTAPLSTPAVFQSTSLYVGDLSPEVNEAILFETFNAVGPVASIRVCRDAITRRSLGYAYVNFHNPADADRALDTMNYTLIRDRPCRLMWSQRDPSVRRSGAGNVFIKSLDKAIDNKALYDTFSAFGNILSCKVVEDENGSKGYGFVHYETQEAADQAIAKVNGMLMNNKKVYVGRFIPKKERVEMMGSQPLRFNNVFVKNLSEDYTEEKVQEVFSAFGKITSVAVMTDETLGSPRRFAFVCFDSPDAAMKAVEEMNGKEMGDKVIYAGRAQKKSEREVELRQQKMERASKYQGVNLYVKNLDETVDDARLRQEFAAYGTITSCKIMRDDKGVSKGFGFVCFSSPEEATKAVTEMNGRMLLSKPLYVALAQRKEERKAQLVQQYAQRNPALRMQAHGLPAPMFPGAAPMFYPGMASQPGMVYPGLQVPRPRWAPPGAPTRPGYAVPNAAYMGVGVPGGQRPAQSRARAPSANRPGQAKGPQSGPQMPPQAGAPRRAFKYAANVRNHPQGVMNLPGGPSGPHQPMMPVSAIPPSMPTQEPLTTSMLAQAPPEQQKQMLGERLYPIIQQTQGDLAGKITGMLLEMDNGELLHLLESRDALMQKVQEAVVVLQHHQQAQAAAQSVLSMDDPNGAHGSDLWPVQE